MGDISPGYLVSTRKLKANVAQPLPAGCGFILLNALAPEYLYICVGEQTTPQRWGVGVQIILPPASTVRAFITSQIDQTIRLAISQGGLVAVDSLSSLVRGDGERIAARGTLLGATFTNATDFVLGGNWFHKTPTAIAAAATVDLAPSIDVYYGAGYYVLSTRVAIQCSTTGWLTLIVNDGSVDCALFHTYVDSVKLVAVEWIIKNMVVYTFINTVPLFFKVSIKSDTIFAGTVAGTISTITPLNTQSNFP